MVGSVRRGDPGVRPTPLCRRGRPSFRTEAIRRAGAHREAESLTPVDTETEKPWICSETVAHQLHLARLTQSGWSAAAQREGGLGAGDHFGGDAAVRIQKHRHRRAMRAEDGPAFRVPVKENGAAQSHSAIAPGTSRSAASLSCSRQGRAGGRPGRAVRGDQAGDGRWACGQSASGWRLAAGGLVMPGTLAADREPEVGAVPANSTDRHSCHCALDTARNDAIAPVARAGLWICGQRKGVATDPASRSRHQFNCSGRADLGPAEIPRCAIFARIRSAIHTKPIQRSYPPGGAPSPFDRLCATLVRPCF